MVVGAGFVGAALAHRLRDRVDSLRVTTRSVERREQLVADDLPAVDVDVADRDDLLAALDGATHEVVSVAAGRGTVYAEGTANVVTVLEGTGAHLVYTSSTGVYAADDGSWVDEDSELVAREGRGAALRSAEDTVLAHGGCVLRLSGLIGRDRGPHRRVEALAGSERADGDAWLNLAPLPTVLDALEAALLRRHHGVVNVSAAEPILRREFYDAVLARAGAEPIRWTDPGPDASKGRRVRVDRLRSALGVEPRPLDLDELLD